MVGKLDLSHLNADDAHESLCCGFNTWFECAGTMVKNECNNEGFKVFREFHNSTIGPLTDLFCPVDLFPGGSATCKKVVSNALPKSGSKPPENTISKLVVQYVPFLFSSKN